MKKVYRLMAFLLVFSSIFLTGCAAITGIFKAGVWTGIIIVVLVVGLIIFLVSRMSSKD